jgi:NADPH-dependent 2,4-dienoyl-CoA reductase/sulfur reductase-like enzyme
LKSGEAVEYDFLVLALGSIPNKFGWPGQDLAGVQGLYHLQDLEKMEAASKSKIRRAVVVGGGLIGIEMAEMWHSRGVPVTFLVREKSFWDIVLPAEESAMINRHILEHGIDLRLGEELLEIQGDETGHARAVVAKNSGERIDCDFVGLTVGVRPNIDFLKNSGLEIGRGILVDDFLETSEKGVFAIGDCAEIRKPQAGRRPIEAIWYTGRMMGQTVARTITDSVAANPQSAIRTPYSPRLWFNSAKFFDIEYQVYGDVPAVLPDSAATIFWEHAGGKKSIRVNFSKADGSVLGFQTMGIRFRHEVCERWILEKAPVETVLKNLSKANFDPEFFERFEGEVLKIFESKKERGFP